MKFGSIFLPVLLGICLLPLAGFASEPVVNVAQLAELTPSVRAANDWFGISIAISGNTVVVGSFDPNIESYGFVYVYVKPSTGWQNMTQVAQLSTSNNATGFGASVAINGNTIIVGAANASNFKHAGFYPSASPGSAYVYVEPAGGWVNMTQSAELLASDGKSGDAFGASVAISENTVAVGAPFAEDSSGNSFAGKSYVFSRPSGGWRGELTETGQLTASDSQLLNYMGASVAVSGSTIIAGAYGHNNFQGAAYVFAEPASGWANMTQTAELTASDGKGSDDFGFSAAVYENTVVLGAPNGAKGNGAAYVFVEPAAGWANMTQTAELRAANATSGDSFGQSAGISGNYVVIGAPAANVGANQLQGAAYLFIKPPAGWVNTAKATEVTAGDGAAFDDFGTSVAVSGASGVVGAPASNVPGIAYVFGP